MPLILPIGDFDAVSVNLIGLAQSIGIECIRVSPEAILGSLERLKVPDIQHSCLAISPAFLKAVGDSVEIPEDFADRISRAFPFVLVYGFAAAPFSEQFLRLLSHNRLIAVNKVPVGSRYEIADSDICGSYAGLSFGPTNPETDCAFGLASGAAAISSLISVNGNPLLAALSCGTSRFFFLATSALADVSAELSTDEAGYTEIPAFSQLLPPVMLFRHIFRERCWQPHERYASLIVDDPPLWPTYGFLNYERLLRLMDAHDFHSTIAYIPHNFRRDSTSVVRLFQQRPDRLSLCFHGNDHTRAEFGARDASALQGMLNTAIARMDFHQSTTALSCDKVMVFPQGIFSVEAMAALRMRNFIAAVNTRPYSWGSHYSPRIADFIQPALLAYGLPLFLRKGVNKFTRENLAFDLFFGKPIFIGAHHDLFQHSEYLEDLIDTINSVSPRVHWSNVQSAIYNSYLTRTLSDATREIRTYSNVGCIDNQSDRPIRLSIDLSENDSDHACKMLLNGQQSLDRVIKKEDRRIAVFVAPGNRCCFDMREQNVGALPRPTGIFQSFHAFFRRRLSEFRDNCLSKSSTILSAAQALQRHLSWF